MNQRKNKCRMTKVLFVCMGNICRSPSAEGVFTALVEKHGLTDEFNIDSCGTINHHTGEAPDSRAQKAAAGRGNDISGLRGRQYRALDFEGFDYIIAMDYDNLRVLYADCNPKFRHKLHLFCSFAENREEDEVPDPYYGGTQGFEDVYDLIEDASIGLLAAIQSSVAK
jgi:protein-tyrosine phosphatase